MMRLILVFLVLVTASPVFAQTWHVNQATGLDSRTCTQAQNPATPKATITNALNNCFSYGAGEGANKTLEIAAGTYTESLVRGYDWPKGSSWSAPFIIRAKAGDTVIIRPGKGQTVFQMNGQSTGVNFFAIFEGLTFDGINTTQVNSHMIIHANRVRFYKNTIIYNAEATTGIFGGELNDQGANVEFIENIITTTQRESSNFGYMMYWGGNNLLFERNTVSNFPDFGIHLYRQFGCPTNAIIRANVFRDFDFNADGQGIAAAVLTCGTGHQVYNNLIYNGEEGISVYTGGSQHVYSNTIYNMSHACIGSQSSNNAIRNNICYSATAPIYGNIFDWFENPNTYSNNLCGQSAAACTLVANPQFVDSANGNLQLQSSSPALNAGADLGSPYNVDIVGVSRPQGSTWDIGVYEVTGEGGSGVARTWNLLARNPTAVALTGVTTDNNKQGNETTPISRVYNHGTNVAATAPQTASGNAFRRWLGCDSTSGTGGRTCNNIMSTEKSSTVEYVLPEQSGPVVWLKCDEGSGTTANDSSGFANHFTAQKGANVQPQGCTTTTTAGFTRDSTLSLNPDRDFTIMARVNLTTNYSGPDEVRPLLIFGTTAAFHIAIWTSLAGAYHECGDGAIAAQFRDWNSVEHRICHANQPTAGNPIWVVLRRSGSTLELRLNSTVVASSSNVGTAGVELTTGAMYLGTSPFNEYQDMTVQQLRLYNRALSVEEMTAIIEGAEAPELRLRAPSDLQLRSLLNLGLRGSAS